MGGEGRGGEGKKRGEKTLCVKLKREERGGNGRERRGDLMH